MDGDGAVPNAPLDKRVGSKLKTISKTTQRIKIMKKRRIGLGSRFVKVDEPRMVWVVDANGSESTPVPHYVLVREDSQNRRRTLSEAVLLDRSFYRQLDER